MHKGVEDGEVTARQGECMQSLLRNNRFVIYCSNIRCVFSNLLIEDFLLHHTKDDQICLLFYRNEDSVVIGRNQALYAEINLEDIKWKIARRFSGGGAVFHDPGNVNYSFIMPRAMFDRRWVSEMVRNALLDKNPNIQVNDRSDLYLDSKKCGGSAYRIIKDKAYHHGTLLISSNLDRLRRSLKSSVQIVEKPSIQSVSASVINFYPFMEIEEFIERVGREFTKRFGDAINHYIQPDLPIDINSINNPEWIVNRGPPYSFLYRGILYKYSEGVLNMLEGERAINIDYKKVFPMLYQSLLEQQEMMTRPKFTEKCI